MDGFFGREVPGATATVSRYRTLYVWPIYTTETLSKIKVAFDLVTQAPAGTAQTSETAVTEYDLYCLSIPDSLMIRSLHGGAANSISRGLDHPTTLADLDDRFERLLFEPFDEGTDYFGDDERKSISTEDSGDEGDAIGDGTGNDRYRGPVGVVRHWSLEAFMRTRLMNSASDQRLGDDFSVDINIGRSGPGYVFLGARRRQFDYGDADSGVPRPDWLPTDNASWSSLARLMGGDIHRNQMAISRHGDALADRMRSLLFEGDPVGMNFTNAKLQHMDILVRGKWSALYDSPYSEYVS